MTQSSREQVIAIIDAVDDMSIATVRDDDYPQATIVSYVNDGPVIYFGTSPHSQKAKNIARNNRVSMTINRDYIDWNEIEGVSIGGRARKVDDVHEQEKVAELMLQKFPEVEQYVPEDPDELLIFRIDPEVASLLDYRKGFGHTELVTM